MDEFAFFFDDKQVIEEVHVIEPPRRKAVVLVFRRKREKISTPFSGFTATWPFYYSVWPAGP